MESNDFGLFTGAKSIDFTAPSPLLHEKAYIDMAMTDIDAMKSVMEANAAMSRMISVILALQFCLCLYFVLLLFSCQSHF